MPAPGNDNFASASVIGGSSGSATGTNNLATIENREPGHFNYNPGPGYPTNQTQVGPFNTVWYSWTCSASGNYFFSTRDETGAMATNFASTVNVFTGNVVSSLARVTTLMDQSVGDGNGADNGASVAFAAISGTVYSIQVDSRMANVTGNFKLTWGGYKATRLGTCTGETVNTDTKCSCVGSVVLNGTTVDAWFPFGENFPVVAGNYVVCYVDGTVVPQYANMIDGGQTFPNVSIVSGDFSGFTRWTTTNPISGQPQAYSEGANVIYCINADDYVCAIASTNIAAPPPTTFPFIGGSSCNLPWICYDAADTIPLTVCGRGLIPHTKAGPIGLCLLIDPVPPGTGIPITPPYPSYNLLVYPMDDTVLNTSPGFNLTGSGTAWNITFNIENTSDQTWDNVTIKLLNIGGISDASAALTGVSLAPNANTTTGSFSFTATPGLVTATIQLSRNGVVACTLGYPLYPIMAASFTYVGGSGLNVFERTGCSPKTWVQKLTVATVWPPGDLGANWGDTINCVFSVASGPATMANDGAFNVCQSVSSVAGSAITPGSTVLSPSFKVTGAVQSVPVQCTLTWNGISLPTFTQTISIPAT
jgi:hypothetical protein